ncbi:GA-like domain-containing protein, partial [Streptococcus suis]
QAEADKLTELNQAVTDAKDAAKPLVDALPAGDVKDGLNDRLDKVTGITVPEVTKTQAPTVKVTNVENRTSASGVAVGTALQIVKDGDRYASGTVLTITLT